MKKTKFKAPEKGEIKKYLEEKNLKFKTSGDNLQIDCILCDDTKHRLGINEETGQWKCFNCNSKGTFPSFKYAYEKKGTFKTKTDIKKDERQKKPKLKANLHIPMFKDLFRKNSKGKLINKAAEYLIKERKLTQECIKHFRIGTRTYFEAKDKETKEKYEYDAGEHVAIPYLINGKCYNIKYRAIDPQEDEDGKLMKWRREVGGVSTLFNDDVIDDLDHKTIFITESEIDCMSLWCLGVKNVIGLTAGADSFLQDWYERLLRYEKVYLVLDRDEAGQEGAKKIAKRIGLGRCYNVQLPDDVKDPNDFLKKYDLDYFDSIARKAKKFDVEDSISLRQALDTIYHQRFIEDNEDVTGFETQYKRLNQIMGPLKPGYLTVISAKPKVGKTTLVLNWMLDWARRGIPVGMYQCEMRPERLAEKFTIMSIPNIRKIEDADPHTILEAKYKLPIDYMQFYYPKPGDLDLEKVCDKIREVVQRYGIKIFCFDNLHFLCRGENENAMIDMTTQAFKLLAEELDIVFILITHPKKTNNNKQLKNEDMKGSSSIYQDADVILLLNRQDVDGDMTPDEQEELKADGSKSPRADIKVTSRWHGGGKTFLAFHEERSLFSDKGILFNSIRAEIEANKPKKKKKTSGF